MQPYEPPVSAHPRRKMSTLGIVLIIVGSCGVLFFAAIAVLGAILFPVFAQAREAARRTACASNARVLSAAVLMYAQDYDERYPPRTTWEDGILPYHSDPEAAACPSWDRQPAYGYNSLMHQRKLEDVPAPHLQPLLFESHLGRRNGSDALESFHPRHPARDGKVGIVSFADGHTRAVSARPAANAGLRSGLQEGGPPR